MNIRAELAGGWCDFSGNGSQGVGKMSSIRFSWLRARQDSVAAAPKVLTAIAVTTLLGIIPTAPADAQAPRLNLTGSWEGQFWGGAAIRLTQDGDRAWGTYEYGNGAGFVRGSWNAGRLILIFTPTSARVGDACEARKLLVVPAKGTAMRIEPFVLDLGGTNSFTGVMTRSSPSPDAVAAVPTGA
jgi:hypothetical protein